MKKLQDSQKTINKMPIVIPCLSIITLNVNAIILQSKDLEWLNGLKKKKKDPTIYCLQETHINSKDKHRLKVKGWKKY